MTRSYTVPVAGDECLVREAGSGPRVGFLAGLGGLPGWLPFLDDLAEDHTVVVPSLPGFHGGGSEGFRSLDGQLDWLAATLDLLEGADLIGADLVACSVSGMLAADVAVYSPQSVRKLVLADSWGLFDPDDRGTDYFALLETEVAPSLAEDQERLAAAMTPPEEVDPVEWTIARIRSNEAAARISWPFGDRGLAKRLHRLRQPTLVLWGEDDRIRPPSYARRFAEGIAGPTEVVVVPGAGHLCVVDDPVTAAKHVRTFLDR